MKHIAIHSVLVSFSLLAFSCSRQDSLSETKEGIDRNSSLDLLGDIGSPTFADIAYKKSVVTSTVPWTDSYWPLTEKSLARRWKSSEQAVGISEYFKSQTAEDKATKVDPYLSPADKYDILFRWRHGIKIDEAKVEELAKVWEAADSGLDMAAIPETRLLIKDVSNSFNAPESENFRKQFPMSANGWSNWLHYTTNDKYKLLDAEDSGEDWSWMGSCHGWAPAALMAETPKHGVLAKFDDKEVLVTEGDIRGLLTKSWADHSPSESQYFIGRRCEQNSADPQGDIPHDASGRGYYGQIVRGEIKTGFLVKAEMYASFARPNDRIYPLSYEGSGKIKGFLLETYMGRRRYSYVLASTMDSLRNYITNGDSANIERLNEVEMFGCWDVNPATFHMALLQKIGKESVGLVMDRTRTGQVWNQPVYGADFSIGELKKVSEVKFSKTRAPGTAFVVSIKADVKWISEPSIQRLVYAPDFNLNHTVVSNYEYVLEFDRNQKLIGGEWGSLEGGDLNLVTPDFIYGFDKGSKPDDDLESGFDFSGIVEQIHKCSLSDKIDGNVTLDGIVTNGQGQLVHRKQKIDYTECVLTKAP